MNKNYITLKKLRIPELKQLCKENKIRGFSKLRKQGIVELLFKNLYPKEQKVLKEELKETYPEIVLKKESLIEVKPIENLEIKIDLLKEKKVEEKVEEKVVEKVVEKDEEKVVEKVEEKVVKKTKEEFDLEYLSILKEKMEKINIKAEKKKLKKLKKLKENYLDLDDSDVIHTINNLIKKIYK